jgi:hypothetical protein
LASVDLEFSDIGIESLDTIWVISPPSGYPGLYSWDRNWFQVTNPKVYPSTYGTWPGSEANNNLSQSVIFFPASVGTTLLKLQVLLLLVVHIAAQRPAPAKQ